MVAHARIGLIGTAVDRNLTLENGPSAVAHGTLGQLVGRAFNGVDGIVTGIGAQL